MSTMQECFMAGAKLGVQLVVVEELADRLETGDKYINMDNIEVQIAQAIRLAKKNGCNPRAKDIVGDLEAIREMIRKKNYDAITSMAVGVRDMATGEILKEM